MGSSPGPWTPAAATTCIVDAERNVVCDYVRQDDVKLIAAAPEMAAMLRELEWVPIEKPAGWTAGDWLTTSMKACPVCKVIHVPDGSSFAEPGLENGHTADCRLAALLKELP